MHVGPSCRSRIKIIHGFTFDCIQHPAKLVAHSVIAWKTSPRNNWCGEIDGTRATQTSENRAIAVSIVFSDVSSLHILMVIISSSPWLAHPSRLLVPTFRVLSFDRLPSIAAVRATSAHRSQQRPECERQIPPVHRESLVNTKQNKKHSTGERDRDRKQKKNLLCFFAFASEIIKGELCVWRCARL